MLDILEQIAQSEKAVTATELNHILQKHLDGKRYMPGSRLQRLTVGVFSHSKFQIERHAILTALSSDISETCNLSNPEGFEMVYAGRVDTKWTLRLQLGIGTRVPLYCTAAGKMYPSSLRKQQRRNLLDQLERVRFSNLTIMDREQLLADLKQIRKQDFSTDAGEYIEGMVAVAVPVRDNYKRV